ncbi:hypothetical protein AAVH_31071 [Aphelenchoides avenae]|nr:hypothetical protein AAVH_31071 [Aphelenchus avenae]
MVVALLVIAIVSRVRSATLQIPVFGTGSSYYEHYFHNLNPGDPRYCNPMQANYTRSQCYNLAEYLTIQVGIGNPEQKFNLTLDGDFLDSDVHSDVVLFSEGAVDTNCADGGASERPIQGRRLFRPRFPA